MCLGVRQKLSIDRLTIGGSSVLPLGKTSSQTFHTQTTTTTTTRYNIHYFWYYIWYTIMKNLKSYSENEEGGDDEDSKCYATSN